MKSVLPLRWLGVVAALACSGPPPTTPAAVAHATPASVCEGDNYQTSIQFDSVGSAPRLTLVYTRPDPDAGALQYAWSFSGDATQIDPGSVDPTGTITGDSVLLKMAGERPLFATLQITNAVGGVATATATVTITPRAADGTCPLPQP